MLEKGRPNGAVRNFTRVVEHLADLTPMMEIVCTNDFLALISKVEWSAYVPQPRGEVRDVQMALQRLLCFQHDGQQALFETNEQGKGGWLGSLVFEKDARPFWYPGNTTTVCLSFPNLEFFLTTPLVGLTVSVNFHLIYIERFKAR